MKIIHSIIHVFTSYISSYVPKQKGLPSFTIYESINGPLQWQHLKQKHIFRRLSVSKGVSYTQSLRSTYLMHVQYAGCEIGTSHGKGN